MKQQTMIVYNFALLCLLTMVCVTYGNDVMHGAEADDEASLTVETIKPTEAPEAPAALVASPNFIKAFRITNAIKSTFVAAHNGGRSIASPSASNMRKMSWDNELQTLATEYSKQCLFKHNPNRRHSRFSYVGENIFLSSNLPFGVWYANGSIWAWEKEKKDYTFNTMACTPNKLCGHYTQVVWATSFKVGCGASLCSQVKVDKAVYTDATLLVCNYGPGGNIRGRQPFEVGSPCSKCAEGDTCVNNLCSNPIRNAAKPTNPQWSQWSQSGECSATCGRGFAIFRRSCNTFVRKDCPGKNAKMELCTTSCTETPSWRVWQTWGACSQSCAGGIRTRNRVCSTGNLRDCSGSSTDSSTCNTQACIAWSNWQTWGTCTVTCGGGRHTRGRTCSTGNNADCKGRSTASSRCNTISCPSWRPWQLWGACTKPCGNGIRTRKRVCSSGTNADCKGQARVTSPCNRQDCIVPSWRVWQTWGTCSQSCAGGIRTRNRVCSTGNLRDCSGSSTDSSTCNTQACIVWSNWQTWGTCTVTCGGGKHTRGRTCSTGNNADCNGRATASSRCNTISCPSWRPWQLWGACTKPCGNGIRTRKRVCISGTNADCKGRATVTSPCNTQDCIVPTWSPWRAWSSCSKSCGGGRKTRSRSCSTGKAPDCVGSAAASVKCNMQDCTTTVITPALGVFTSWSQWSKCSSSCGTGSQLRRRICIGGNCRGSNEETQPCVLRPCTNSQWTKWRMWTTCSKTCGGGIRKRFRTCNRGNSGPTCSGSKTDFDICNTIPCLPDRGNPKEKATTSPKPENPLKPTKIINTAKEKDGGGEFVTISSTTAGTGCAAAPKYAFFIVYLSTLSTMFVLR